MNARHEKKSGAQALSRFFPAGALRLSAALGLSLLLAGCPLPDADAGDSGNNGTPVTPPGPVPPGPVVPAPVPAISFGALFDQVEADYSVNPAAVRIYWDSAKHRDLSLAAGDIVINQALWDLIGAGVVSGINITFDAVPGATSEQKKMSAEDEDTIKNAIGDALAAAGVPYSISTSSGIDTGAAYAVEPPAYDASFNWGNNTAGIDASVSGKVRLVVGDYEPTSAQFVISSPEHQALFSGKTVEVWIEKGTGAASVIPLHHVHTIYQGLNGKYGISGAPIIDSATLAPSFDGKEWFFYSDIDGSIKDLYSQYSVGNIIFGTDGNGIKVIRPYADNKYMLEYSRPIEIVNLEYNYNSVIPFHGVGLKKEAGGSFSNTDWSNVYIDGINNSSYGISQDCKTYFEDLKEAGLFGVSPDSATPLFPIRQDMAFTAKAGEENIMENGLYDFILAYQRGGYGDRLRDFGLSSFTFDGLGDSAWAENMFGARPNADSGPSRNNPVITPANGLQHYNPGFKGNISAYMARYLIDHTIREFANTAIIGDPIIDSYGNFGVDLRNVSIIGNFLNPSTMGGNYYGVIDICGNAPVNIINYSSSKSARLILRKTPIPMGYMNFSVVDVMVPRNQVKYVGMATFAMPSPPNLLITYDKYSLNNVDVYSKTGSNRPMFKAVRDPNDLTVVKFAPASLSDSWYAHSPPNPSQSSYYPDTGIEAWRSAAERAKANPPNGGQWNIGASPAPKWVTSDFTTDTGALPQRSPLVPGDAEGIMPSVAPPAF